MKAECAKVNVPEQEQMISIVKDSMESDNQAALIRVDGVKVAGVCEKVNGQEEPVFHLDTKVNGPEPDDEHGNVPANARDEATVNAQRDGTNDQALAHGGSVAKNIFKGRHGSLTGAINKDTALTGVNLFGEVNTDGKDEATLESNSDHVLSATTKIYDLSATTKIYDPSETTKIYDAI